MIRYLLVAILAALPFFGSANAQSRPTASPDPFLGTWHQPAPQACDFKVARAAWEAIIKLDRVNEAGVYEGSFRVSCADGKMDLGPEKPISGAVGTDKYIRNAVRVGDRMRLTITWPNGWIGVYEIGSDGIGTFTSPARNVMPLAMKKTPLPSAPGPVASTPRRPPG